MDIYRIISNRKMPKEKTSVSNTLAKYVAEHRDIFKTDGRILFCKICNKNVNHKRKFLVDQHLLSQKHVDLHNRHTEKLAQPLMTSSSFGINKDPFFMDLCEAFISADIPLSKLNNPALVKFFKQYTKETIPSESTLRKNYVDEIYQKQLDEMKTTLKNHFLWVSVDETTDIQGRFVASIMVGILHEDEDLSRKQYLLNLVELEKTNHATIARAVNESLELLGAEFEKERVLLFLTDAAPYMVKAGKALKIFVPKLLHVTCLAHALHRVAEQIKSDFDDVDNLIANGKKIFLKAPLRVEAFKETYPDINLPPQPVITRWGTWLDAVKYYCEHYEKFKTFVEGLDEADSCSIAKTKNILKISSLKNELAFIKANYCFLSDEITKLEGRNNLRNHIKIIDDTTTKIENVQGEMGEKIKQKLHLVLQKNKGFKTIKKIVNILDSVDNSTSTTISYLPNELASFKYAPITSVEVERSFSLYKSFFRSNRESFVFQNAKKMFVIYANRALSQ